MATSYDPTTYAGAEYDTSPDEEYVNPYEGGPRQQELAPHLTSIHNQPTWEGQYFTTTDTSAPLGGTYSLLSNTGMNADAPVTYDFLNHMPDTWGRTAGEGSVGDYLAARGPFAMDPEDARYPEHYRRTLHSVADANASLAFDRKYMDDMKARLGDYRYGTEYALDSTSPNKGVDPIPLLGEWVNRDPNDLSIPYDNTWDTQVEWDAGMGPDYEYSEQNYSGYDGNRFKTLDENGSVIEHNNYADLERDGEYFNTGYNRNKFTNIPYIKDRINPAVHPEYINRNGLAVKWEGGYGGNDSYNVNNNTNRYGETNETPQYDPNANYNPQGAYFQNGQQYYGDVQDSSGYNPNYGNPPSTGPSTGPSYGSDYGLAMTNQMNTPSSGGGFGLGYDSAMTSEIGSDTASAKGFSTEYEENIKGLLDTLRGGG